MAWPRNELDPVPVNLNAFAEEFMTAMGTGTDMARAIERVRQASPTLYLLLIARVVRSEDRGPDGFARY
jgi:hypothetical protein